MSAHTLSVYEAVIAGGPGIYTPDGSGGVTNMLDRQAGEDQTRGNECPTCHAGEGERCRPEPGWPTGSAVHQARAVLVGHTSPYLLDDLRYQQIERLNAKAAR